MSDVDVIVCSWAGDDFDLTLRVVEAAVAQAGEEHVIVVDMCPDRRFVDRLEQVRGVAVEHMPESSGLGESRQRGLEAAVERYVAFLDSDAVPRAGWLDSLRAALEPGSVAIAGGPVLPVWPEGARVPRLFRTGPAGDFLSMLDIGPEAIDVPRVLPGNMAVDRELIGELGFDEGRGRNRGDLLGAEEIGMMLAVRRAGLRIVYAPGAAVDHRSRAERMSWRWMWKRVHAAGREAALNEERLEPMPRRMGFRDRAFLAAVALPYLAGRRLGR